MTATDLTGPAATGQQRVSIPYETLRAAVAAYFTGRGLPPDRADRAATALCYGDLTGMDSHGVFNLPRLYAPLLDSGRADPSAEPRVLTDTGPCALVDHRRALGLWAASDAMDEAVARARAFGVGVVSVRGGTHFGCAGVHALRAAEQGLVGVVASNCGGQRIARPPLGAAALLGTNPLSVAAPALDGHPFVLDMSTTVVPTGRVRTAASRGLPVPEGWLTDDTGRPVTDPAAYDRGEAWLGWLGDGRRPARSRVSDSAWSWNCWPPSCPVRPPAPPRTRSPVTAGPAARTTTSASCCWPSTRTCCAASAAPSPRTAARCSARSWTARRARDTARSATPATARPNSPASGGGRAFR